MSLEARDDVTRHVPRAAGAARALSFGREANSRGASPFILHVRRRGAGAVLAVLLSAGGANAAKVACGQTHTCAIRDDGNVWCWGSNGSGQLGQGSTGGSSPNPVEVDLGVGRTAKAISVGLSHNCVILDDDTLKCWGGNWTASWGTATKPTGTLHQRHPWISAPGARRRPCPAAPHTPARYSTTIASSAGAMAVTVSLESAIT